MAIKEQAQRRHQHGAQRWPTLAVALAIPFVAATIGGLATSRSVITWYPTLKKPEWNPPSWLFAPVWNLLYLLMGIASWLIWQKGAATTTRAQGSHTPLKAQSHRALALYGIQLTLNALWSVIFFGMRRIDLALVAIVPLWSTLLATMGAFYRIQPVAASLLIPYQLWVTFASVLNARVWQLNR